MKKIICFLLGHKWYGTVTEEDGIEYPYKCERCNKLGCSLNKLPEMTEEYIKKNYPIPAMQ